MILHFEPYENKTEKSRVSVITLKWGAPFAAQSKAVLRPYQGLSGGMD